VYDSTTGIDEESSDDGIQGLCGPDGELVGPDESIETLEEYSFPISGGVRDSSEDSEVLVGKKRQLDEKKKDPLEIARDTLMEVCMTTEEARIEQELRNKLNRHLAKTIDEQRGDPEAVGLQTPFRPMPPGRRALLQRLMDAAREGNVPALQAALADGADVDARSLTNATSLHAAALGGHVEAMRVLLAAGADPNARDEFNQSTLHLAAQSGSIPAVRLLVEDAGAALTLVSVIGDTARDAAHFEALMHEDHADNITHFRDPTRAAALRSVEAYLAGKGCGFLDPRVPPDERMRRAAEHWDPDRTGYFFEGHSILDDPGFLRRPEIRQRVGESDAMHRARVLAVRQGVAASKAKEQRREALRRNKAALEKFKPNDKVFDTAGLVLPRPARPDGAPWRDALGRTQEEYDRDYDPDESGNEYGERIHRRNTSLEWDESWRWTEARERKLREALARQERAWDEALAKRLDDSTSSLSVDDPPPDPNKVSPSPAPCKCTCARLRPLVLNAPVLLLPDALPRRVGRGALDRDGARTSGRRPRRPEGVRCGPALKA